MPTSLHDRLLYAEARIAMVEDKIADLRARLRDLGRGLIAAGELVLMYAVIRFLDKHLTKGAK